jgi:hypothetical protein
MPGKFLIDLTDQRFLIAANEDVIGFVRRTNPFAHTDVGIRVLELAKELPGAHAYCPSYMSCAYVVLHNDASRIFAIAYGQRGLAFRLAPVGYAEAVEDGGTPAPAIGPDWLSFAAYDMKGETGTRERLTHWCARAFADTTAV